MEDRNVIKSKDLCERCHFVAGGEHCTKTPCGECEMQKPNRECKCDDVQQGTPCTYFKEREES